MLLPEDQRYLSDKEWPYRVVDSTNPHLLIIERYPLPEGYSETAVKLLLEVPPGYPDAGLDMFWVHPTIKFSKNDQLPQAADSMEPKCDDLSWQRFSRHGYPWKPGDSIVSYLIWIRRELEDNVRALG